MQCRYDNLNRNALWDVELYDRTGRVRTPSPGPLSGSEDDNHFDSQTFLDYTFSEAEGDYSPRNDEDTVHDEKEERCSLQNNQGIEVSASESTTAGEEDSDFQATEFEYELDSTLKSTSKSNGSIGSENSSETGEDLSRAPSESSTPRRKFVNNFKPASESNPPSQGTHVRYRSCLLPWFLRN